MKRELSYNDNNHKFYVRDWNDKELIIPIDSEWYHKILETAYSRVKEPNMKKYMEESIYICRKNKGIVVGSKY